MGLSVYVYYRVPATRETAFREAATVMQAGLTRRTGVPAALKRRPEEKDGLHTWMEVYESVPDGFEAALADAVREACLGNWIEGERRREVFEDIASCA